MDKDKVLERTEHAIYFAKFQSSSLRDNWGCRANFAAFRKRSGWRFGDFFGDLVLKLANSTAFGNKNNRGVV